MSAALRVEDYLLAVPAIDLGIALADASAKFAAERSRIANQRERFDELCRLAEAEATPDQLAAIAAHLNNFERQLAAILVPVIRSAEQTIAKRLPAGAPAAQRSFHKLSEEAADIASKWLEAYQNAQIRLYRLASEKMEAAGHPSVEIRDAADLDKYFQEFSE
jgi:hypothetical protein